MRTWIVVVAWSLMATLCGGLGYVFGSKTKQGEWDAAVISQSAGQDAALKAAAAAIAKIEVKSVTYLQPVRTEVRTNPVYRDCQHSADSLRNINALITGDELAGDGGVSASQPAR